MNSVLHKVVSSLHDVLLDDVMVPSLHDILLVDVVVTSLNGVMVASLHEAQGQMHVEATSITLEEETKTIKSQQFKPNFHVPFNALRQFLEKINVYLSITVHEN